MQDSIGRAVACSVAANGPLPALRALVTALEAREAAQQAAALEPPAASEATLPFQDGQAVIGLWRGDTKVVGIVVGQGVGHFYEVRLNEPVKLAQWTDGEPRVLDTVMLHSTKLFRLPDEIGLYQAEVERQLAHLLKQL